MTRWIDRAADAYCKLLELLLVALLAAMVVMVFGNVVLRYAFNSGITVSEELSRWAFVWMSFLGAIIGVREGGHLGTDMLVSRLGITGKKVCLAIAESLMLYTCWLIGEGSLAQTRINIDVQAPVSGWSMGWMSAIGVLFALSAGAFHLYKLGRLFSGRLREDELVEVRESEDLAIAPTGTGERA